MTQALDERDLLVKKINDKIEKIKLVDVKKRNEETTADNRISVEEFSKNAESAYQQITDLIERYQRLDAAIIALMLRPGLKPYMASTLLPMRSHCVTV